MTLNPPPPACANCLHERYEHTTAGNACTVTTENTGPGLRERWRCPCPGYVAEQHDVLTPDESLRAVRSPSWASLLPLSEAEDALLRACRADPTQWVHVAEVDAWHRVTVRHPIDERVTGDLFDCEVLTDALDAMLAPGRHYRTPDGEWVRHA